MTTTTNPNAVDRDGPRETALADEHGILDAEVRHVGGGKVSVLLDVKALDDLLAGETAYSEEDCFTEDDIDDARREGYSDGRREVLAEITRLASELKSAS